MLINISKTITHYMYKMMKSKTKWIQWNEMLQKSVECIKIH